MIHLPEDELNKGEIELPKFRKPPPKIKSCKLRDSYFVCMCNNCFWNYPASCMVFSASELALATNYYYSHSCLIGKGGFGKVYKANFEIVWWLQSRF